MDKLYCPVKGASCLEKDCALYYDKELRCAILTGCDLFSNFQEILLKQTDSCLQMMDLINLLDGHSDEPQLKY